MDEVRSKERTALAPSERSVASTIASIWAEVLSVEPVGAESDFFELGGTSLAAVRMLAALGDTMSVQVDFNEFVERPTVGGLADAVARARRQQNEPPRQDVRDGVAHGEPRLSFAQERLWFLEQLGGSTAAYNIPIAVRLRGAIDVDAMQRALRAVVSRHEALRTTFSTVAGHAIAVCTQSAEVEFELVDLRAERDPELDAQRIISERASRSFDLERGPLVRAALLRLPHEECVLELVFHHLVCDGSSRSVIMLELGTLYDACRTGEPAALARPRVQYRDFARRQRWTLEAQGLERVVAPWLERLVGAPEALELPTDRPRPAVPGNAGATYRMRLGPTTAAAVREFARAAKATRFATLLSVFCVLLYRHGGQHDIVIGTTTAGRNHPDLEDGVGLFANTVALRCDLSGSPSFIELVGRVREAMLWAIAHDQAPLQEIVARLPVERDLSRHPLFQVFCSQMPLAALDVDGAEPYDVRPTTSRVDLTLFVEKALADQLDLAWEYSTDLFDADTIERLAQRYMRLLEAALGDPQQSIDELPLLGGVEREQALAAGRQSHRDYPVYCMHEAFERRAAAAPDAIAVSFEGRSLTYGQLNVRANRLAHRLIGHGAGPETLVALLLEPSLELVAAILGVLKAGAAYLPLDPEHPRERVEFMLADAGAKLIVTEQRLLERVGDVDATTVCLDRDAAQLEALSAANPATAVAPESLAYVIYTSGSTGRPKGVQVEHRQIARLFSATEEWFGFGPRDVWTLLHSYAFDFSVWELWGALAHGGELVVSPLWTTRSPEALAALVASRGVTVLNATPSLFTAVQGELLRHASDLALRFIVFGGEALRPSALRPWFEHYGDGGPTLVNMYGITETTVHVTYRPLRPADCEQETSPIGVPIADLSVYVLDRKRLPVPAGVAGELYVGGAGVSRGYLNRPELTAERFIENPFGSGRLYRTGDIAARLADAQLEFRGRIDDQVKIRGFRIELGEIEAALREHPSVREALVVAREEAAEEKRLVAYVVADGAGSAAARLLEHLRERLPGHMVPAAVTPIDQIPLTRNGKIDRGALPVPSWEKQAVTRFVEPEAGTETTVAQVWASVLALERVGALDNFFNLGGHSLLAGRVVTEVRERCRVEVSVRTLFEQPTLREFAAAVDIAQTMRPSAWQERRSSTELDGENARQPARTGCAAHPLSFPQQQLLFYEELTPGKATYNAGLAWRVVGPLEVHALHLALTGVFSRQEALRTVLVWGDQAIPSQVVLDECKVELPIVELYSLTGEDREAQLARLLAEHARRPFDLSCDAMLRTTLFRLGPDEHVILFTAHHVAFDAWALEILYREVGELYAATLAGRDPQLPELPLQYRDFAAWQREQLESDLLRDELDFWRTHLAGAPTATSLPTDRPRPAAQTFRGATHHFVLGSGLTNAVHEMCAARHVTPYMLLLAAFGTLLYRHSGQDDILVGGPMANRQRAFEHLIGFFANTVVVRVRLGGNPTFSELLARVRASVLASYEHQEVPLELVVEAVRPHRDPAVHPLFQVNFRVRVGDAPSLELAGTHTQPVPVDLGLARFELALELHVLEERIEAELNYNTELFDQPTVQRLAGDFESVLRTLTADPHTRLLSVQLASEQTQASGSRGGVPADARAAIGRFRQAGSLRR